MTIFKKILCFIFVISSSVNAFAQTTPNHPELSKWLEVSPATPYTEEDKAALKTVYTSIHDDLVTQIEAEASALSLLAGTYLRGDKAAVALMTYTLTIKVDAGVASEDLWYSFLLLKMRRLTQQVMGAAAPHYLTADNLAYKKLREIMAELTTRGINLPGVNIKKSMNIERS